MSVDVYDWIEMRDEKLKSGARLKTIAICCSLASAVIAGTLGFGITYGVMKSKENKNEENQTAYVQTYNMEKQKDIVVNEEENVITLEQ